MNKVTPPDPLRGGEPGSAASQSINLSLACTAEVIGKETAGPAYDSLSVALAFGLILIPIVGSLG